MEAKRERVLIIGSSFIRRLRDDTKNKVNPLFEYREDFGLGVDVQYLCKGGWKLHDVEEHLSSIADCSPDYIFLQCRANDLLNFKYGETVGDKIVELAKHIKQSCGAAEICVGPCLERRTGRYLSAPQAEQYNQKALRANLFLKVVAPDLGVIFWRHRGLTRQRDSGLEDAFFAGWGAPFQTRPI